MSRKLTGLNPYHPHTRLVRFRQSIKEQYRKLTTVELDQLVNATFASMSDEEAEKHPHPIHRHQKMEFLLERAAVLFKKEWEQKYGWPFDHCYDNAKLKAAVRAMTNPELQAEFSLKPDPVQVPVSNEPIDHRLLDLDGNEITKEQFDAFGSEQQELMRKDLNERLLAIRDSGFAGILANGGIVDRRKFPEAIPMQANSKMGIPAPKDVPVAEEVKADAPAT